MTAGSRFAARKLLQLSLTAGLAFGLAGIGSAEDASAARAADAPVLLALHAVRGEHPAIVDARNRQVILRGVNLNSLGDYYQADRRLAPVVAVTARDWDSMARHGFDVVRLLVSWSKLEPRRGHVDGAYLRQIHRAVDAASARGIYTVIDMHQDAWGKYIASPTGVVCPEGRDPAIGWDGAPEWATLTDGADTCTAGSREASEAVLTAWDSFYANRAGIMDQLVAVWGTIAREFKRDPAVAGYDLLNEPNHGHGDQVKVTLATYYAKAIAAIRAAETGPAAFHHIVFFETTVFGTPVASTFTTDGNIVFAPHNYGESIGNIPLEGEFAYYDTLARGYQTPLWIGEYGWFGDPPANAEKLGRYAATEDSMITAGDTWWQWRQACGDPHSIGHPGGTPDRVLIHFQRNRCPGDHNGGVVPQWACVWRPYPRASPGRLTALHSGCAGNLRLAGTTDRPGTIDVWYPGAHGQVPRVEGEQVSGVRVTNVPGGFRIQARVAGSYTLTASQV
ncbi:MAG: glycoside hydrolase family 5 protein [Acidimicrobiia bacterium]